MALLDTGNLSAWSPTGHEEVGLFSLDRWGIGSLVVIGAFVGTGIILLFRWAGTKGVLSIATALLLFIGGGIILAVKATESIERVEPRGYDPLGKAGVVTMVVERGMACSVRVDGMDWSARSKETLAVGDGVVVVSREGLHLSVVKRKPLP